MQETKCNITFEPLYKSYSDKEVVGSLCHISDPKMTIGYKDGRFWGSARNGGITTPIDEKRLATIIKIHKLDVLLPSEFESYSQK